MADKAKTTLQIRVTEDEKAMIKADAKALGMTPGRYVATVCGVVNESVRKMAAGELVDAMTKAMLKGLEKS